MFSKILTTTQKTLWSSLSIIAISSSIFSTTAMAQQNTASDPSVVLPPSLQTEPKINLKVASTVMENGKWTGKFDYSNNNNWENDVKCNTLSSRFNGMSGMADYNDGISLEKFRTYPNVNEIKSLYNSRYLGSCENLNQKVGNVDVCDYTLLTPETFEESKRPRIAMCSVPTKEAFSSQEITPKNTPVFAYQYRYEIKFDAQNKTQMSNDYRGMTGTDGDYDGVTFAYTYYTFRENGQWKTWENPNKDNKWGGWLIYGNESTSCNQMLGECMPMHPDTSATQIRTNGKAYASQNDTDPYNYVYLNYDPKTNIIKWNGEYNQEICNATLTSKIEKTFDNKYLLILAENNNSPEKPCTLALQNSQFEGSQSLNLNANDLNNFRNLFSFQPVILNGSSSASMRTSSQMQNSSQTSQFSSTNSQMSSRTSSQNSSQANTFKTITLSKSLDGKTDLLAKFQYAPDGRSLSYQVELIGYSGCDIVKTSKVSMVNGKLIFNLEVPFAQMCTANIISDFHSSNQVLDSTFDSELVKRALETGNIQIIKTMGTNITSIYPQPTAN